MGPSALIPLLAHFIRGAAPIAARHIGKRMLTPELRKQLMPGIKNYFRSTSFSKDPRAVEKLYNYLSKKSNGYDPKLVKEMFDFSKGEYQLSSKGKSILRAETRGRDIRNLALQGGLGAFTTYGIGNLLDEGEAPKQPDRLKMPDDVKKGFDDRRKKLKEDLKKELANKPEYKAERFRSNNPSLVPHLSAIMASDIPVASKRVIMEQMMPQVAQEEANRNAADLQESKLAGLLNNARATNAEKYKYDMSLADRKGNWALLATAMRGKQQNQNAVPGSKASPLSKEGTTYIGNELLKYMSNNDSAWWRTLGHSGPERGDYEKALSSLLAYANQAGLKTADQVAALIPNAVQQDMIDWGSNSDWEVNPRLGSMLAFHKSLGQDDDGNLFAMDDLDTYENSAYDLLGGDSGITYDQYRDMYRMLNLEGLQ
jgi:hypothetical protein